MDSLSIVIPAFNEERRLPESLDRILDWLKQTRPAFSEVLVVDDGSLDSTAAVVEEYAKTHPSVRLLRYAGG